MLVLISQNKQDVLRRVVFIKRTFLYFTLICFLSGCIMVPKTHEFQQPRCELITKKLTVTVKDLDLTQARHSNVNMNPVGLLGLPFALAFLFTASVVVSGSIVVAGNSIHWIEQEGTCDDGKIRNAVADLTDSIMSVGGQVITSSKQLVDWLMFWKEKEEAKIQEEQDEQEGQGEQEVQDALHLENPPAAVDLHGVDTTEQAELEPDTLIEEDNKLYADSSPDEIEPLVDEKQTDAMKSPDNVILNNKSEN